jgi:iron complex outermembrane receptor protein
MIMRIIKHMLFYAIGVAGLGAPLSAVLAQEAASAKMGETISSDEIVVTARKREELISAVPIAVSAFTGDQLRAQGVASVADIANLAAGVVLREDVAGRASPSIVIRGIGFDDFRSNGNPAVAVNIDQVYFGSNALLSGAIFDIERVEIVKGPQGTLYGRHSRRVECDQ